MKRSAVLAMIARRGNARNATNADRDATIKALRELYGGAPAKMAARAELLYREAFEEPYILVDERNDCMVKWRRWFPRVAKVPRFYHEGEVQHDHGWRGPGAS